MKNLFFIALAVFMLSGCKNGSDSAENKTTIYDSSSVSNTTPAVSEANDNPGIVGIIELPEILTLAVKDSAPQQDIGFKIGKAYSAIEGDMQELNVSNNGMPAGALYYNSDPKNFVFECVIPINQMPSKQPKNSSVVVLEATRAILYNYYGPYDKMADAYAEIKTYMEQNKLEATGPFREFYITDATAEKDPSKWLSKIYIPVK